MKKLSSILLAALLAFALLISCAEQIVPTDEVATVKLLTGNSIAKNLSSNVTLEDINDPTLEWHYSAKKVSQLEFITGQTTDSTITLGSTISLSQGKWDFSLWALKNNKRVYAGELKGVLIVKGVAPVSVAIPVAPSIAGQNGSIQFSNVKIQTHTTDGSINTTDANQVKVDGQVITLDVTGSALVEGLTPGDHQVIVSYIAVVDGVEVTYATETIFVTVYSNRTTTISGNVMEEIGSAQMGVVATSSQVSKPNIAVTDGKSAATEIAVKVSPANTTDKQTAEKQTVIAFPEGALKSGDTSLSSSVSAQLTVNTKSIANNFTASDSTLTPVAGLDINLSVDNIPVTEFNSQSVVITTYIAKGLTGVKVKYEGIGEQPVATDDVSAADKSVAAILNADDTIALGYNPNTGLLRFSTTHFSEFNVFSNAICYVVETNTGYETLQAAVDALLSTKGTIKLLKKTAGAGFEAKANADIVVDFNNFNYTITSALLNTNTAFKIDSGAKVVIKNCSNLKADAALALATAVESSGDLTLDNVKLSKAADTLVLVNGGNLYLKGNTYLYSDSDKTSLDICYTPSVDINGVSAYIDNSIIRFGSIKYGSDGTDKENVAQKAKLYINSGQLSSSSIIAYNLAQDLQTGIVNSVAGFNTDLIATDGLNYYSNLSDALDYSAQNSTITLLKDIFIDDSITVSKNTVTLDLNGKTVSTEKPIWNDSFFKTWSLISVQGRGNLTVTGNGNLKPLQNDVYSFDVQDKGHLTIENGTFIGNTHCVYAYSGNVVINGGKFSVYQDGTPEANRLLINCYDSHYIKGIANIKINGGEYLFFNPMNCTAERKNTNFVSPEYDVAKRIVGTETWYEVVAKQLWSSVADTSWYDSNKTEFLINTPEKLAGLSKLVMDGNNFSGKNIKLENNIDLAGKVWTPIGNLNLSRPFAGNFDGQNFTISNMRAEDNTKGGYASSGLFGENRGQISRVKLSNIDVVSTHYAGGIVGYSTANNGMKISNCSVDGGRILSYPELLSTGVYDNGDKAGGIIGYMVVGDVVDGCTVSNLTITAYRDIGGIVGCAAGTVTNNTVTNVILTQDNTNGYKTTRPNTISAIVGREESGYVASNTNTETNVTVKWDPLK